MIPDFLLSGRAIANGSRTYLIAEIGQAHDGSLGNAHAYVDLAADIGVDAVKFQTHIAAAESTRDEQFRVKFSYQDATRFDYWKRMEFTPEQWAGLKHHADERKIEFLSTPFSPEAVELLRSVGVPAWKVGSGDIGNLDLLGHIAKDGKPVILSTGMSEMEATANSVKFFNDRKCQVAVMQCTSKYPTPLEEVGINLIDEISQKLSVPSGLSDHSGSIFPALLAMARGAALVELHLTLHKAAFGPDSIASLDPEEFRQVVKARDAFWVMDSNPMDKAQFAAGMGTMRSLFNRSLALKSDRPAGHVIEDGDLALKKPGTGLAEGERNAVVGRRLVKDVSADRLLRREDLDD
tara:strand:+ start:26599 stop:27648 length:1050 start_codon:yes stop_codon:yes gene_type:complete